MPAETVSVITPVYNSAQYLNRCVTSILQQTYSNLEVLLIDDGSTDKSGELCDKWASKDTRIRVIHKQNSGVSDARNTGIDNAIGAYLLFVDSDDYIAPGMVQTLYDAMLGNNSDLGICAVSFVDENERPISDRNQYSPFKDELLSGAEAIQKLGKPHGWYYHLACNKLYKTTLFSDVRFPKGKICGEDAFIAHHLFGKCASIISISTVLYFYTQHNASASHSKGSKAYLHDVESYLDRAVYCNEHGLFSSAGRAYWQSAMFLPNIDKLDKGAPDLLAEYQETLFVFRRNFKLCKYCTLKERLQLSLVAISPGFYRFIFRNSFRKQAKELRQKSIRKRKQ